MTYEEKGEIRGTSGPSEDRRRRRHHRFTRGDAGSFVHNPGVKSLFRSYTHSTRTRPRIRSPGGTYEKGTWCL